MYGAEATTVPVQWPHCPLVIWLLSGTRVTLMSSVVAVPPHIANFPSVLPA